MGPVFGRTRGTGRDSRVEKGALAEGASLRSFAVEFHPQDADMSAWNVRSRKSCGRITC